MEIIAIYLFAVLWLVTVNYLIKKYMLLQEWLDENPEHFDSYLWLTIPAMMSITVLLECYVRNTQQPITAAIFYFLLIAFWDNIISAIDKWVPTALEPMLKLGLAPILIPVTILQTLGVLQKRYYAPFFKESKMQ